MNDYKQNITLSDAYGQGYLSLFYDFSSELLPHEMALLELLETLDYSNFDASLKREANIDPNRICLTCGKCGDLIRSHKPTGCVHDRNRGDRKKYCP